MNTLERLRFVLRYYYLEIQGVTETEDFARSLRKAVAPGQKVKLSLSTVQKLRTGALALTLEHLALLADLQGKSLAMVLSELAMLAMKAESGKLLLVAPAPRSRRRRRKP